MIKFTTVLKSEISSLEQPLETRCTIFIHHFIELGTDDEMLEFLQFSSLNPNVQRLIK